jgi:hypothetical protein
MVKQQAETQCSRAARFITLLIAGKRMAGLSPAYCGFGAMHRLRDFTPKTD